jgi:predicted transcriptional regulator
MDRKQKEALILALAEKGKTYREITREAGVSPNTIKAVLNKAGLDQNTSLASRVFEFYSQQKTPSPLEAAIKLGLESDKAIRYHKEYFMLLGCTEFTKVYPLIKDNPHPFVNLVKLVLNSGMGDGEVVELLKIANGYLPLVRLEYDRTKAELNSWKAELSNVVRIYQQFVDSNVALKKERR